MKNNFPQKVYDLFDFGGYCPSWETGLSNVDCLHHILGRVSDSPYNACPLNNFLDHMPEGRKDLPSLSSFEVKKTYLRKTKKYLYASGYIPNQKDKEFLAKHTKYYN